jgi:hypothetical protein
VPAHPLAVDSADGPGQDPWPALPPHPCQPHAPPTGHSQAGSYAAVPQDPRTPDNTSPYLQSPDLPQPPYPQLHYPPGSQPPYPQGAYPQSQRPYPPGPQPPFPQGAYARPRPGAQLARPVAYEVVAGTPFGLALVPVASTCSGPAAASAVTGSGSIVGSLVVACFAALGAEAGWGPMVAGAFAVLAAFAGVAALALGWVALGQIGRAAGSVRGRALAIIGLSCGGVGLLLTAGAFGLSLLALA